MTLINRLRISSTSGDRNSFSQAFSNNYFAIPRESKVAVFSKDLPSFSTIGGTEDYYGQNPLSIFTNLSKPSIRYNFTGSSSAITQVKQIVHRIYKVDYESYKNFQNNQPNTIITKNIKTGNSLEKTNFTTDQTINETLGGNNTINFYRGFNEPLTLENAKLLQPLLTDPVSIITASTEDITTNIYDFYPEQYIKKEGGLKQELFEDKSQYFIETDFKFEIDKGLKYEDYSTYIDNKLVDSKWNNSVEFTTTSNSHTIQKGDFTGLNVRGNYFTYFTVPEKPEFEYPLVEGNLTTFAPEFFWSNSEKADEYLVQVSYNTGDTSFSGTIFNYPVLKTEANKKIAKSKIKDTSKEFESEKTIRFGSISLKGNATPFIYRVGNVKYIVNIFGVRQFVVTFSEYKSAVTQSNPVHTYVKVLSDSPHITTLSSFTTPDSILNESPLAEYSLNGVVSGSIVTGATMQLTFPNSAYITTSTNSVGYFEFNNLEQGNYVLTTTYRGYETNTQNINLTANTTSNIEVQINWDNVYDNWAYKENDIIYY